MAQKGRTKDEYFMIRLYNETREHSETEGIFDRYQIGQAVGLQVKAVDTICNALAQANFIKKHGKVDISITPNGDRLVESLIE